MLGAVGGINLGEFFGNRKRTCFPNEQGFRSNFGQRIDHIVVQRNFIDGTGPFAINHFDVVQEFGGGRRFCSDHCPLYFNLERTGRTRGYAISGAVGNLTLVTSVSFLISGAAGNLPSRGQ